MKLMQRFNLHSKFLILLALFFSQTSYALTLYEDSNNQWELNGRFAAQSEWINGQDNDHDPVNKSSRSRLSYQHRFNGEWSAFARTEYGYDPFLKTGHFESFKRHQFVGVTSSELGTLSYGKQYTSWYSLVAGWTDQFWIYGAEAAGTFSGRKSDGSFEGTGRADRALVYKNRWNDFTLGTYLQGPSDGSSSTVDIDNTTSPVTRHRYKDGAEREFTAGFAANWQLATNITFGIAYNHSKIKDYADNNPNNDNVNATLVGLRWAPGNWYLAATAGSYHNLIRKSVFSGKAGKDGTDSVRGYEAITRYDFKNLAPGVFQLYAGLNRMEDRHSDARLSYYLIGAAWLPLGSDWILALEHQLNDRHNVGGQVVGDDRTGIMIRFNY